MPEMSGASDPRLIHVTDKNGDSIEPRYAIFPILRKSGDGKFDLIGTGFFITYNGIFVTARHVLEVAVDGEGNQLCELHLVQFSPNNRCTLRPVLSLSRHARADVAVGVCYPMSDTVTGEILMNPILKLSQSRPSVGEAVVTYAYPGTEILHSDIQRINANAHFFAGNIQEYYPNGRDTKILPLPCYRTNITLNGGSSGGPVFGSRGRVVGINSTGFAGANDISFISRIEDTYKLRIDAVQLPGETEPQGTSITELAARGYVTLD